MGHRLTLIPGDGIGPEVTDAATAVIAAVGVAIDWERVEVGEAAVERHGTPLPPAVLDAIRRSGSALKGPVTTPVGKGFVSVNVTLRKSLDLYACLRRARNLPGLRTPFENVDLIVVRENTEGLYSGIEHEVVGGVIESLKIITERASQRIAEYAFDLAARESRRKVTAVHKANIMKLSDGLFLDTCRRVGDRYPEIAYEEMIVDNACMQLVRNPAQFEILVMENFYGDVLSDLAAGLVGGLGVVPGANIGTDCAVFEAVHGSAPDIAGQGLANPTGLILSGVEMLRHIGEAGAAARVETAVGRVIGEGKHLTRDLGGSAGTRAFTDAVIAALSSSGQSPFSVGGSVT
jgi:isocitrate dehydrogenase (NAD+)